MRIVVQVVKTSKVEINKEIVGQIGKGFMVLVGFNNDDNQYIVDKMVEKMINLRVFEDENGKMNLSLKDIGGSILSISQFTLYADLVKGRRPGFTKAGKPDVSEPLYDYFNQKIRENGINLETGIFGAMMDVSLINQGPTTIIMDSEEIIKK